jgi:hypothetical protein
MAILLAIGHQIPKVIIATVATKDALSFYRVIRPYFTSLGMNDSDSIASISQKFQGIENQHLSPGEEFYQKALLVNQFMGNIAAPQDQSQRRYGVITLDDSLSPPVPVGSPAN